MVHKAQELIGMAVQYSSELQAIDSVESPKFQAAELSKIIDTLISNSEIKEILVSRQRNNNIPAEKEIAYKGAARSGNKTLKYTIQYMNRVHDLNENARYYYATYA